jgi:alpha-galactosidase
MSDDEYRTHMSLWSMLAAPLLAGNDLRNMTPDILEILTNREVIAIDQDTAGKEARRVSGSEDQEVWAKPLADGGEAIGLFNRGGKPAQINFKWSAVGLNGAPTHARDLWGHIDLKISGVEYSAMVPAHGVVMLRVSK